MKKIFIVLHALISSLPLTCMEIVTPYKSEFVHAPRTEYPADIGYMPVEKVLEETTDMPPDMKEEADQFFKAHPEIVQEWCTIPTKDSKSKYAAMILKAHELGNMSTHNIALYTSNNKSVVAKIAGWDSRIRSNISSLGYDPYTFQKDRKDEVASIYEQANKFHPTMQHITYAIGQTLLQKFNEKSNTVQSLPTYLFHLPEQPTDLGDSHWVAIQKAIPTGYIQFTSLTLQEKKEFLSELDLSEFYATIKYLHYAFPSEDNLWVNTNEGKIILPDLESPNNEGLGVDAKYRKTILGQDRVGLPKVKHNISVGHDVFAKILQSYGMEQESKEWTKLYKEDKNV